MALARAASKALTTAEQTGTGLDGDRDHATDEAAVVAMLAAWFATPNAIRATTLPAPLIAELGELAITEQAARHAGMLALSRRLTGRSRYGAPAPFDGMTATRRVAAEEPRMRGRYVLAAARRLTQADGGFPAALGRERHYVEAHVQAGRKRRAAASRVDALTAGQNRWLVWRTMRDDRVDPRCLLLEGRLFTAADPPDGVYPGAAHPRCRCYPAVWSGPLFT